jgi:hypothetical protein
MSFTTILADHAGIMHAPRTSLFLVLKPAPVTDGR